MSQHPVAFADLKAQHEEVRQEIDAAISRVRQHGQFIKGPEVAAFEKAFAHYCEASRCIGASNGTSALHAALRSAGIGPGDEVIIPSHTFMATVESVRHCGATPVFADIEEGTMLLDAMAVKAAITPRTRAVVPVHLYGLMADMDSLGALAERHGLMLIEDAAQAHGASWRGRRAGSVGLAASFSFFPSKNLGAMGDAGAVTTNDPALADRCARYVDHGRDSKYTHLDEGTNYRLDTMQAAILLAKLPRLDAWNEGRRRAAALYREVLSSEPFASLPVRLQAVPDEAVHVYHLFVVRVAQRDRVIEQLAMRGIATGIHYPVPCHLQRAAFDLGCAAGSLPVTERVASEIISLPMHPHLSPSEVERVCDALRESIPAGVTAS